MRMPFQDVAGLDRMEAEGRFAARIQWAVRELASLAPGLSKAPMGIGLLLLGVLLGRVGAGALWRSALLLALVGLAVLSIAFLVALSVLALRTRYLRHFGSVAPAIAMGGSPNAARVALGAAALCIALAALQALFENRLPFRLPAALLSLSLALRWLDRRRIAHHWLAFSLAIALSSLLGKQTPLGGGDLLFCQLLGFGLIAMGACDHLLLARILGPRPDLSGEDEGPTL